MENTLHSTERTRNTICKVNKLVFPFILYLRYLDSFLNHLYC